MDQQSNDQSAVAKDVQTKSGVEVFAGGTGHIALTMMNLLHLDQISTRLLQLKHYQTSMLLDLLQEKDKKETVFLGR